MRSLSSERDANHQAAPIRRQARQQQPNHVRTGQKQHERGRTDEQQ
jgi:hypothetical protein